MRPLKRTTVRAAGLAAAALIASLGAIPPALAQAQDAELQRLRLQLRDCSGPGCVDRREQLLATLRNRLRDCAPAQCREYRAELQIQERLRDCDRSNQACRELRAEARERERAGDGIRSAPPVGEVPAPRPPGVPPRDSAGGGRR